MIFRVQDDTGRGPWRPGFSKQWVDWEEWAAPVLPSFMEEFGWAPTEVPRLFRAGETGGCGCRTLDQLLRWFTPTERARLERYGYQIVMMEEGRVIAESVNQVVFARREPLTVGAIVVPWPASIVVRP